jgi:beta-phosphoglucomutase
MTVSALIFDLDGVLTAASAEFHYQSWQQLADEEGIPFDRERNERLRGVPRGESLRRFLDGRHIGPAQTQDLLARKQAYYLALLADMTPDDCLPGVQPLLAAAHTAGVPLGVASASRNAAVVLERLRLRRYFTVVGTSDFGGNPKPAPDLFVWVAGYLQATIPRTVVLEDSAEGVTAAQSAGFLTVGVGPGAVDHAHLAVPDLRSITLETLVNL